MATTTTTNITLVKPDYDEAADVQVLNGNADKIDTAFGVIYNAFGIVVNGNKAALSAATGQFVILKNSTISGRSDGLYTAAKAIPANTAIDNTYLTAVSGGGLNAVRSLFDSISYNANTDRTVESNRTAAMDYLQANYFSKGYHFAMVRYSNGYYFGYIYVGSYNNDETIIIEIPHTESASLIIWRKTYETYIKTAIT